MSRIYSNTNRIKFTDIPEKFAIPRSFRAKQCEVHSAIVVYVCDHYKDTKKYRQTVVDALNILTYCIMQGELPSFKWMSTDPLATMPDIDLALVESVLNGFYLTPEAIEWDVKPTDNMISGSEDAEPIVQPNKESKTSSTSSPKKNDKKKTTASSSKKEQSSDSTKISNRPLHQIKEQQRLETADRFLPTPKSDLYVQPPKCLRFDTSKVWMSANVNGDELVIYTTLPEIPQSQNDISVTTDPTRMTDAEFMHLYPNHLIHTRAQNMYFEYEGLEYDPDLGCIIPVEGFTTEQIKDNIIKYPHLFKLKKMTDQGPQPFFHTIEIDGELKSTVEVWDTLPESKIIPRDSEFVKEYVIRRYLLEKEAGIEHKYNIMGGLEPFLTLFMPSTMYIEKGYTDTLSIVKRCVMARIHYKQSRNPILRRIEKSV